ncbi:TetR family transcriptional regulator [Marinobacterium nitratireducens]|uniref:TetR family transcriptional regulator n=1 Tax=Marinobacterium nitratireducens TaxID=518897 RepID=A0A917Z7Z9_9GAMM|nr:TetR family transcriptional regulator [Marinobacterium nitratireducens]GGO77787.1 TetR family transcriptional regulator [Marinobacterium nitratireducens]
MVRRSPQEAEKTRQALLQSALDVFSEKGAANGTLKEVAARAQVTHGALYWHFKDRAALLQGLFEHSELPFDQHYLEQLQASRQDALEALEGYLLGLLRDIHTQPHSHKVYRLFYSGSDTCAELAGLAGLRREALEQPLEHIHHFLKLARKQGLIGLKKRQLDPMASAIFCLLVGVLQSAQLTPELFSCDNQGALLVRSCIDGLRASAK